jgi:3-oxoadipate enol-lactonase
MHDTVGHAEGDPKIRFWTAGCNGPRILLVMGYAMRGDLWRPQVEGLSPDHQVAWYDHRGVGESERGPKSKWTMGDMAHDALRVMDALGWETCHLVGVSMGGMIAQEMTLAEQKRFLSLSLIVTHAGGPLTRKVPPAKGLRAFLAANLKRGDDRMNAIRVLLYPDEYVKATDQQALRERIKIQLGRPTSRSTALAHLYAVSRHDTRARLQQLSLPTLIVKAGQDILVQPRSADRLLALIPHAQLVTFPDAGHGIIFQKANALNDCIRRHVARAAIS